VAPDSPHKVAFSPMVSNGAKRRVAGRYELEDELGAGGMGVVWRGRDLLLDRAVAVKEVDLPAVDAEQRAALRARVSREARAAARLNHPGAVTVYDIVAEAGRDFIVMELVDAPTLDDLVREHGPLDPARAAALGLGLLGALEAAHRAGIVHRDLKPKNVMVEADGSPKLADFGVASLQGDPRLTATGLVVGSPAYMAPEQVEGGPVTPATDLWALGATLWFAVEGEPPFGGGEFQTLTAIVHEPPRRAARLGPLGPVADRLLAKDPAARATPAELRGLLGRVAAGERPGTTPPAPTRASRHAGAARRGPGATRVLGRPLPPGPHPAPGGPGRRRPGRPLPPVPVPAPAGAPGRPAPPRPARSRRARAAGVVLVLALLAGAVGWALAAGDGGPKPARQRSPSATKPAVPASWRSYAGPGGAYRLAYPPGWRPVPGGAFVDFESPDRDRFFRVQPTSDPLAPLPAQQQLERAFVGRHAGDHYQRVRLAPVPYRGGAAVWEFTFVQRGRRYHGYDITFRAGRYRHAILFQAPATDWAGAKDDLYAFLAGFQPAG
jgi:eukaryotic-like serine/threonine-protein kinase